MEKRRSSGTNALNASMRSTTTPRYEGRKDRVCVMLSCAVVLPVSNRH